ncbi:hypothetical protein PR202_gb00709 [Eleusine coracana subsp. coracana]|uniref:Uncharacterized protein n=1 Tax=Eleusine coracana subsp. coracana TaxID=191504 RepID=A0AAV5DUZ7_ELECO|nr:hypothetical protein PR202_gb00709 [Eleusine coracana subsp. coracana]
MCSARTRELTLARNKAKREKPEQDDDMIRVQLETLLAEKSRLAQEDSTYARENRFLCEIVEFHQFTAHDVNSDMEDDDDQEEDSNLIHTKISYQQLKKTLNMKNSPMSLLGLNILSSVEEKHHHQNPATQQTQSQMHQHLFDACQVFFCCCQLATDTF